MRVSAYLNVLAVLGVAATASAQEPPQPPPPPPPQAVPWVPAPPPPTMPPPQAAVALDFVTDKPAELQTLLGSQQTGYIWQTICRSSCRVLADSRLAYRIAGDSIVTTESFLLDRGPRMTLHAEPASKNQLLLGLILGYGGGSMFLTGAATLGVGEAVRGDGSTNSSQDARSVQRFGAGMMVLGGAAAIVGAILFFPNLETKVSVSATSGAAKIPAPSGIALIPGGFSF